MKKILALLLVILLFSACKKLEDLNENTKDPAEVTGESLFTNAQKSLFDQMVSSNVNLNIFRMFAQYWTETTYTDEANYDLVTRTIPDNHWDILYRDVLKDLKESAKVIGETDYPTDASPKIKSNKLAIVEIMSIYTWSVLVETFGNIPYSEALDIDKPTPKYDDGLTVYKDLIARLNTAIAGLDPSWGSFDMADNMYYGNVSQWLKFAYSLKLKMGLVLADADAAYAQTVVEAAAPHVFLSNADNARLIYASSQPNANPIYDDLVASGRHDFVAANTIVDAMNALDDPRRPFYFTLAPDTNVYIGGEYGASNDFTQYSHVADKIQLPTFEGIILDYAEIEFYLAEAAARGFAVGGTAEGHYNNAITASISYWGGTPGEIATYLSNTAVAYTTATGTWQQKIGTQMWIALYNRGFEAWTNWRRYDYPVLVAPPDAMTDLPVRFTYPIAEQTLNGANYSSASSAIGGDDVTTKLFWDKF
ncbi:MAG TPA: SusD/RagB family nutrient-binding outer membrane lipoprotein [Bacteroidales bacterium]|nr:SusD/RagB family nutrient-binding outer membrane lipoprotein [Bacteroidales bacterium]